MAYRGMVVTDLDGTLFQRERRASERNLAALQRLGRQSVLRVIATGRNLFSARKVLPLDFPIDCVLFSSGAGIMDWPGQKLLRTISMKVAEVVQAFDSLSTRGLDFMVHRPIPDNHHFLYYPSGRENPDFRARCSIYQEFAVPGDPKSPPLEEACQLVAVEPYTDHSSAYESLRAELAGLKVIRTTSPLDGRSRWIEIFPPQVSKALAAAWLASARDVPEEEVLAVGNDYNDLDLLQWAPRALLVSGSPPELTRRFPSVTTGDDSDFAEAVAAWERGAL